MRRLFRNRPAQPRGGFTRRIRTPRSRTRKVREDLNELMADIDPTHPNYPIDDQGESSQHTWSPRTDVIERDDEYVISVELPGVARDDIRLEQYNDILHVYGVRRKRFDAEYRLTAQESEYGPFSRTIPLPLDADRDDITASYRQGVLTIHLPRVTTPEAKKIEVG